MKNEKKCSKFRWGRSVLSSPSMDTITCKFKEFSLQKSRISFRTGPIRSSSLYAGMITDTLAGGSSCCSKRFCGSNVY